ncbi:hypothetical protein ACGFZA_08005 [Streptomyces sp. NPDC048211]|uniref:hypothetical protein n=1 Tax=Streptomyces sp. NPDC048211 TaxID=3365516 RepID=UPI003720184F
MPIGRVNAAKFIKRDLPEPHETDFGGEEAHELFNAFHADICCPPSGYSISWDDWYAYADQFPVTWKADWFLEPGGEPKPIPAHLTGEARERAERAGTHAAWVRREAHRRGLR